MQNEVDMTLNACFESVVGYEDVKNEVYEYCDILRNPEKYQKYGVYSPRGILLYGEPGVGKSLMSSCIIKACERTAFVIRKNKPDVSFVDYIKEIFDKAKAEAPSIVVLDDLDKFSNDDYDHRNAQEYVTVQACIDDIKNDEVFVIATVNDIELLPDSLKRTGRFDRIIEIKRPEEEEATEIIRYHLSKKGELSGVDINEMAEIMSGTTCAVLEAVINEAGIIAIHSNRDEIQRDDIIKAYLRLAFKAPERRSRYSRSGEYEQKLHIAIHEAGHTLVSELLDPGSAKLVSICKHTGNVGGITSTHKSDSYMLSNEKYRHRLLVLMAGRAAIEIVTGNMDMGSGDDMMRARDIVDETLKTCAPHDFATITTDIYRDPEVQREMRMKQVAFELDRYYKEAKKLIIDNRKYLDLITEALMEKETITQREIKKIFERVSVA